MSYNSSTMLKFNSSITISDEGIQQGDSLALCFFLSYNSSVVAFAFQRTCHWLYIDDITLCDHIDIVTVTDVILLKDKGISHFIRYTP